MIALLLFVIFRQREDSELNVSAAHDSTRVERITEIHRAAGCEELAPGLNDIRRRLIHEVRVGIVIRESHYLLIGVDQLFVLKI